MESHTTKQAIQILVLYSSYGFNGTALEHLNAGLVLYSDPHCI